VKPGNTEDGWSDATQEIAVKLLDLNQRGVAKEVLIEARFLCLLYPPKAENVR